MSDKYAVSISFDKYRDYYTAKEHSRMPLANPEEYIDTEDGFLFYDDFSNTIYKTEMSQEGRESFDAYLQSNIDTIAKKVKLPSVDIEQYRKRIALLSRPRIPS
jgi:hypothetical protein